MVILNWVAYPQASDIVVWLRGMVRKIWICTNITHHPAVQRHEYTLQLLKLRGSPRVEVTPTANDQPFLPSPNYFPSILVTWLPPQNAGCGAVDPGQYIIICLRHYRSSGAGSWKGRGRRMAVEREGPAWGGWACPPEQYINIPDLLEELVKFVQFQNCDRQLGHPVIPPKKNKNYPEPRYFMQVMCKYMYLLICLWGLRSRMATQFENYMSMLESFWHVLQHFEPFQLVYFPLKTNWSTNCPPPKRGLPKSKTLFKLSFFKG